jgi:hypothetical protein
MQIFHQRANGKKFFTERENTQIFFHSMQRNFPSRFYFFLQTHKTFLSHRHVALISLGVNQICWM